MNKFVALLVLAFSLAPGAHADYAVLDNGELMPKGAFKFTGTAQALTENAGLNLSGRADIGINNDFAVRGLLGFGKTDLYTGALVKWIPIPDTDSQPAIGGNAGLIYVKDGDVSDLIIRVEPMVSKKVKIEDVVFTPYGSFPVGFRTRKSDVDGVDDESDVTLQMVVGTQLKIPQFEQLQFIAEVGIDLNESPGYISAGVVYYMDPPGETSAPASNSNDGGVED